MPKKLLSIKKWSIWLNITLNNMKKNLMSWLNFKCFKIKKSSKLSERQWGLKSRLLKPMWQPFCIGCHIGIHPDASISSILTHQLHLSKVVHKTNSLHPSYPCYVWRSKTELITIRLMIQFSIFPSLNLATENFWSPTFNHHNWQPKNFSCLILVTITNNQKKFNLLEIFKEISQKLSSFYQ